MDFKMKKDDCICCITAIWQHKLNAYKLLLLGLLQAGPGYNFYGSQAQTSYKSGIYYVLTYKVK